MILALVLATAAAGAPVTAIDAERAFIREAQTAGQWTAFRKWAADDATMFTPQPVNAQAFLKDRKDPPVSIYWWPGRSYVSCDGSFAVNTGPWVRDGGKSVGYFTTVWKRQPNGGWKWIYDGGGDLEVPRAEGGDIQPTTAACPDAPIAPPPQREIPADLKSAHGSSSDGTLQWWWTVAPDGRRTFDALLWDGSKWATAVDDRIAASE
jgi:hypothetical protein